MLLSFALGLLSVFAYAPYGHAWLLPITLAWWMARTLRAQSARDALFHGLAYGLGMFGFGVYWIHIALHEFGGMILPLAWFATCLLALYCALFFALPAYVTYRLKRDDWVLRNFIVFASLLVLAELGRTYLFTGFAWLPFAATQVDGSALVSLAPIGGSALVSFAVALIAALLAWAWPAYFPRPLRLATALGLISGLYVGCKLLGLYDFTALGQERLSVSLVQTNTAQKEKFLAQFEAKHTAVINELVGKSKGQLTILPETALPKVFDPKTAPNFNQAVMTGIIAEDNQRFSNAAVLLSEPHKLYRKQHLVPFGEYMPLRTWFGWFYSNVAIPMSDLEAGKPTQLPLQFKGITLATSICYEDVYSEPLQVQLNQNTAQAAVLLNLTNDAWYGESFAARQHLQLSQLRAAEFQRPMLRATNTGITASIDERGRVVATLPWYQQGVLETTVDPRKGSTPFQQHGQATILGILLSLLGLLLLPRYLKHGN